MEVDLDALRHLIPPPPPVSEALDFADDEAALLIPPPSPLASLLDCGGLDADTNDAFLRSAVPDAAVVPDAATVPDATAAQWGKRPKKRK